MTFAQLAMDHAKFATCWLTAYLVIFYLIPRFLLFVGSIPFLGAIATVPIAFVLFHTGNVVYFGARLIGYNNTASIIACVAYWFVVVMALVMWITVGASNQKQLEWFRS